MSKFTIESKDSIKTALKRLVETGTGCLIVLGKKKELIGTLTDGDLRRCLNQDVDLKRTQIGSIMTSKFKSISGDSLAIDAAEEMEQNKIFSLVVTSNSSNKTGIITMHQLLEAGII